MGGRGFTGGGKVKVVVFMIVVDGLPYKMVGVASSMLYLPGRMQKLKMLSVQVSSLLVSDLHLCCLILDQLSPMSLDIFFGVLILLVIPLTFLSVYLPPRRLFSDKSGIPSFCCDFLWV